MNTICIKTDEKINFFTFCENISVMESLTFFTLEYDTKTNSTAEIDDVCNNFLDYAKKGIFYKYEINHKEDKVIFKISVYTEYISFISNF